MFNLDSPGFESGANSYDPRWYQSSQPLTLSEAPTSSAFRVSTTTSAGCRRGQGVENRSKEVRVEGAGRGKVG